MKKNITIILNTHMPYVLGNKDIFDEPENWLFEAITETYIPLITSLNQWDSESAQGKRIIFSLTPCLLQQLAECKPRYLQYLAILQKIAFFELERSKSSSLYDAYEKHPKHFNQEQLQLLQQTTEAYLKRINSAIAFMQTHDLLSELKRAARKNPDHFEIWTSSPNHNFLPFFKDQTASHFIRRGIEIFEDHFQQKPSGFWLPECAFRPGIEQLLTDAGIQRTAVTPHAISVYHPEIKSGIYQHKNLQLLVHDYRLAMHIWKAELDTIPSNPLYREFYRDMGMDVKPEYFAELGINLPPLRHNGVWTGFKYYASTAHQLRLSDKDLYNPAAAQAQVRADVSNFFNLLEQKADLCHDRSSFVLAFDTELFGHWWHEGTDWLAHLLKHPMNP